MKRKHKIVGLVLSIFGGKQSVNKDIRRIKKDNDKKNKNNDIGYLKDLCIAFSEYYHKDWIAKEDLIKRLNYVNFQLKHSKDYMISYISGIVSGLTVSIILNFSTEKFVKGMPEMAGIIMEIILFAFEAGILLFLVILYSKVCRTFSNSTIDYIFHTERNILLEKIKQECGLDLDI
jgi:hypothetical protein